MPRNPNSPHNSGCGPIHTHTSASENIKLQMMMAKLEESLKNEIKSISTIEKTDTENLIDTYTISYSDGTTSAFTITNGKDGVTGDKGAAPQLRATTTHIQYGFTGEDGLVSEDAWTDIIELETLKGPQGLKGDSVQLQITNTHIQWRNSDEDNWENLIELKELQGPKGDDGYTPVKDVDYFDGLEIELQKSASHIQWRYKTPDNSETWANLIPLEELKGDAGNGIKGVELLTSDPENRSDTYKIVFDDDNYNTFTLKNGADGRPVVIAKENDNIVWYYTGSENNTAEHTIITSLAELKGDRGDDGLSAYDIWKNLEGNTDKSEADFIASLKGVTGNSAYEIATAIQGPFEDEQAWLNSLKGDAGESAYEVAVAEGFKGTVEEWLTSLKGTDGTGISLKANKDTCQAPGDAYIINDADDENYGHIFILADVETRTFKDGGEIKGPRGEKGDDGHEVELQVTNTAIQWKYKDQNSNWVDLIALSELKGKDGQNGNDGRPIELQIASGYIQWRISGDTTWQNLVSTDSLKLTYDNLTDAQKAELKGEQGPRGYGIKGVRHYEQVGLRHTYELYFEDPNIDSIEGCTFDVYDGAAGKNGAPGPGIKEIQVVDENVIEGDKSYSKYCIIFENNSIPNFIFKLPHGEQGLRGEVGPIGKTGPQGEPGKSAYQSWLDSNHTGNEAEFIAWLKGKKGDPGAAGKDGKDGANGKDGAQGPQGEKGVGIASIEHEHNDVSGNCIYTITLTDGTTKEFTVYRGPQGEKGENGLTTAIKVGGLTYTHENGTITLPNFTTPEYVAAEITKAKLEGEDVDLSGFATQEDIRVAIAGLVDSAPATLSTLGELAQAHTALLDTVNKKAAADHNHDDRYIKEHQSLTEYAKKSELFSKDYNDLVNKPTIPNVEGLASEDYVDNKVTGLATEDFVTKKITEAELGNKDINLDAYYTKTEVDAKIPSLDGYAKTEDIPTDYLKESDLEGYSKFSGSYNDLTNKPEIPSINGLASEEWVQTELSTQLKDYIKLTDLQIGEDFITDITVGHLEAGFEVKSTMTFGELIKRMLRHPSNFCEHVYSKATCTTPKICSICGHTEGTALGHVEETIEGKAATCTETGLTDGVKCSRCGVILSAQQTIPATGHTWSTWTRTIEPTCDTKGQDTRTCTVCGATETREVNALGHNYTSAVTKSATCTEPGVRTYTCVNDPTHTYTESIAALGHNYTSEITTAASCETPGVRTYTCSRCGHSYTEEIPATGHKAAAAVRENEVAAQCETTGSYDLVTYCSVCGEEVSRETKTIPALGHTYGEWVTTKEPEIDIPGEKTKTCSRCGHVITEEIPALEPEEPTPTALSYKSGTFGNLTEEDWPMDSYWSSEQQQNIAKHYVDCMYSTEVSEQDLLKPHTSFEIMLDSVDLSSVYSQENGDEKTDSYSTAPAIVLPENYSVTRWSANSDIESTYGDYNISSYNLKDGRIVYYSDDRVPTGQTKIYYLTITKQE